MSACTLPYEQLSTPGAINGAGETSSISKSGMAISTAGNNSTKTERVFEGSGEFAKFPGSSSSSSSTSGERSDGAIGAPNATGTKNGGRPGLNGQSSASGGVGQDGITINLVNASVSDAAKIVLGESLGLNYVVSEKVKANITLRTVKPVDKNGLVEIFDAVLRAEGAALVAEGKLYKIVPIADAGGGGAPLLTGNRRTRQQIGQGTEIVPLRYVAAQEMERILRSAAPQAGVLRVDTARNLIILSGSKNELQSMADMISVFDVDWMRGMSFAILPVETSDVDAIAQELDTVFANDRDSPTKGIVRFVPNRRLKSILVISSRPEYLSKAETWLKRIDMASRATEKQVHVYSVQHRAAAELAALLQKVYFGRDGGRSGQGNQSSSRSTTTASLPDVSASGSQRSDSGATPFGVPAISPPTVAAPGPVGTSTTPAAPSRSGDTNGLGVTDSVVSTNSSTNERSAGGGGLPPDDRFAGVSIVADESNNSLVITATSAEYKRMRTILQSIDVAGRQILLEATIAEVTLKDDLKFGLRWFLQRGAHQFKFTDSVAGAVEPVAPGFSYFFNLANIQVVLNALSTVSEVNIVSSPSLMVVENKKAVLQVGDEVPIATQSAVAVATPGAPIVNSVSYRSAGVILGVTPRVSDEGQVLLEIEQEVSSVAATTSSTIDSPTIQQRRVKTTVAVKDGATIVLAGLIQDNSTRNRDQVPLLGTIPLIGNAFKNKTDTVRRTELLIAITPQVVRNDQQIDNITAEYRDKINLSTRPQRRVGPDHREQLDRILR